MHCRSKALAENNLAIKIFFLSILLKAKKRMDNQSIRTSSWQMIFLREGKTLAIEIKLMKVNSYLACGIFPWEPHYWIIQLKPLQFFIFHGKLPKQLAPYAVTMAWISAGWELCLSLSVFALVFVFVIVFAFVCLFTCLCLCHSGLDICTMRTGATRELKLLAFIEREREGCCNFSTAASFLLFKSSECRPMMGFACIWDVITVQSTNEYSLIQPPIMQIFKLTWNFTQQIFILHWLAHFIYSHSFDCLQISSS